MNALVPSSLLALACFLPVTATAAANQNITVVVVDVATPNPPLAGVVVTLRGTDPLSLNGLVQTMNSSGTTTFVNVSGPYSVTAQLDFTVGGDTTRAATSVVDIVPAVTGNPPAGTIGLFIEAPDDVPPTPPSVLFGSILNAPTLTGAEILEVVAVDRLTTEVVASSQPSAGFYSFLVPSGRALDCYAAHRGSPFSGPVLSSVISTGVGPFAPSSANPLNIDFANAVPWTTAVSVTESGRSPNSWIGVQLVIRDVSTHMWLDFSIWDDPLAPATILLPDVTHPSFAGLRVVLDADTWAPTPSGIELEQSWELALTSTPSAVHFDFMAAPTPIQPSPGTLLAPSDLGALAVQFIEAAAPAGFGANGVNYFWIESDPDDPCPAPPGIDAASWTLFTRVGDTHFDLPPAALPMFATGQRVYSGVSQFRFLGINVVFDTFFNGNIGANVAALDTSTPAQCESGAEFILNFDTDKFCATGTSASGCQATLSTSGLPSATAGSGFVVSAAAVEGNKSGMYFFGVNGRQNLPWGTSSSTFCVVTPVRRADLMIGGGTNGACNGSFVQDFNAMWCPSCPLPLHNPGAGAVVQAQLWYRDPANPSGWTTSLSDAIEFCVRQ